MVTQTKPKKQRYRLMQGMHAEGRKNPLDSKGKVEAKERKIYNKGDIIETESDLLRLNGAGDLAPKFVLVGSVEDLAVVAPQVAGEIQPNDALDDMAMTDLRRIAEEEEIDLSGLSKKHEIAQAIRSAHV